MDARVWLMRTRPWPERPVSAANKDGSDTAATRRTVTNLRSLQAAGDRAQGRSQARSGRERSSGVSPARAAIGSGG